jgi:hypothetical protein
MQKRAITVEPIHPSNGVGILAPVGKIDWNAIVTEDDTPVDNYTTEEHGGLMTDTLYDSFSHPVYGKQFIVAADVGIFYTPHDPPIVPDIFLSLGLNKPQDRRHKRSRSYFIWEVGKAPEVVIEIVSNQEGEEEGAKKEKYAELGILYYAVFDPLHELSEQTLRLYKLEHGVYVEMSDFWMPEVHLGLTLWRGRHQELEGEWLRWCDQEGRVIPTGKELAEQERLRVEQEQQRTQLERWRAEQERLRAEQEQQRARQEHQRAEQEHQRAERLAARLRELGIEPDENEGAAP